MAESTNSRVDSSPPRWAVLAIALLSLPAFLLGLTVPFIGPDEPRYAEVGREMWQSGDWITPTLGGYHWFEKPPLLYWLEASSYSVFGVNEFAARLGPALCGLATVLCLWLLARYALDPAEKYLANWFAVIAASTLGLITFSHAATTDVVVTLPLTVAMSAFFVFDRRLSRGKTGLSLGGPLAIMYGAAGAALLAKGLIGIIFPPVILAAYYLVSKGWPPAKLLLSAIWGIPLTLGVAAIWYLPMYERYGDEFINEFIIRQHFERFVTNVFQHPQRWYFYLYVLPLMTLPWLPLFLTGSWRAVRLRLSNKPKLDSTSALLYFACCWLLVPLVFFSASTSKLPGYVLPALPPAILISAIAVQDLAMKHRIWVWITTSLAGATLVIVSVLLVTAFPERARQRSVKPLIAAANDRDLGSARVLFLHSYNFGAEFYARGRFDRDPLGRQVRLFGVEEVKSEIKSLGDHTALVIVPKEYASTLGDRMDLDAVMLAENSSDAIYAVTLK